MKGQTLRSLQGSLSESLVTQGLLSFWVQTEGELLSWEFLLTMAALLPLTVLVKEIS